MYSYYCVYKIFILRNFTKVCVKMLENISEARENNK
jgi:hypothetical protein